MKKDNSRVLKLIFAVGTIIIITSTVSYAAWWGTPGYEWARSKGLTSISNTNTLNNSVSMQNFYSSIIKYLQYKGVSPKKNIKQNVGSSTYHNQTLVAYASNINGYISKNSLTPAEYRKVDTWIEHAHKTINEQANLLTKDDLKEFDLYMSLSKYKAATLINDETYKASVLATLGATKYKELVIYNIKPYYGSISRKEFLVLMFSLISDQNLSEDQIIEQFRDSGVLMGYNDDMMLSKDLTYAEMFTFFRRFETFEFNPTANTEDSTATDEIK